MPLWNIAPSAVAASAIDWDWQYVWSPLVFYVACVFVLFGAGRIPDVRSNRLTWPFQMISSSLTRLTGMPGWAAATVLSALLMLWMAVLGFYWDVAWHIDFGRDRQLFTPPHTMIVLGLGGLVYCAGVAITFATIEKAPVGFRVGPLHVPWSAPCLAAFGIGGVAAFPFDNLWHQTYGVDVTLWTPTHLQLLSGGVFSTIAVWLTIAEARGQSRPTLVGRLIHIVAAGAVLVGLSTFQGEFDFGASQFQMLYLPVLVAATAAFSLVAARLILGPGGAIKAVAAYLVLRTALSAIVGGSLQHTLPHFPLYLPSAVCVEVVALLLRTSHPLRFALAAGISVGTLGLALEWLWIDSWGLSFLSPVLIPKAAMLGPLAAAGAALLATGLATAFTGDSLRIPATVVAIGGLAVVAALAYPYPREVSDVAATVGVEASADSDSGIVNVRLDPPDAAKGATVFAVTSWHGGGHIARALEETGPGMYRTSDTVPIAGAWKTTVTLERGDEVMAAPVYLPPEPTVGAPAVVPQAQRGERFQPLTDVVLREQHAGPAWPAVLAYVTVAAIAVIWLLLVSLVVQRVGNGRRDPFQAQRRDPAPMPASM